MKWLDVIQSEKVGAAAVMALSRQQDTTGLLHCDSSWDTIPSSPLVGVLGGVIELLMLGIPVTITAFVLPEILPRKLAVSIRHCPSLTS